MDNLKLLRKELGISQQCLADKFNVSQQSIYKYEHSLAEPDIFTLKQMADFFHTSVDFLIGHDTSDFFCTENNLTAMLLILMVQTLFYVLMGTGYIWRLGDKK